MLNPDIHFSKLLFSFTALFIITQLDVNSEMIFHSMTNGYISLEQLRARKDSLVMFVNIGNALFPDFRTGTPAVMRIY